MISGLSSPKIANALMWSNFFLAYQGEDDRALQVRYAALVARALDQADPAWRAPLAAPPVAAGKAQ